MLASEIKVIPELYIELPKTDCVRVLVVQQDLDRWVAEHGDQEVKKDGRTFRVPGFADGIAKANEIKAEQCRRWGCE